LEPSSPEVIVPSPQPPPAEQPMDIDANTTTTTTSADNGSAEPQRMQRKLVSKTYVNDQGYMGV